MSCYIHEILIENIDAYNILHHILLATKSGMITKGLQRAMLISVVNFVYMRFVFVVYGNRCRRHGSIIFIKFPTVNKRPLTLRMLFYRTMIKTANDLLTI